VILGPDKPAAWIDITPDGQRLVFKSDDLSVRVSLLGGRPDQRSRVLYTARGHMDEALRPSLAPDGSFVVFGTFNGSVWVVPLDAGPSRELTGFTDLVQFVAVDPQSRRVAGGGGTFIREQAFVRVWDLESGETQILDVGDGRPVGYLEFTAEGDLLVDSGTHVRRWDISGSAPRVVEDVDMSGPFLLWGQRAGGNEILFVREGRLLIHDFDEGTSRELSSHGRYVAGAQFDPTGEIVVSSDRKGIIRVGPVTGEEPHLLLGHKGLVQGLAVSSDGRWIATCGDDKRIRLWPMPDLSKAPLHTLPRPELIAKLKTLTNLRVVEAPDSPSGWTLEVGPFPGWETVPTW
jgi:WD40 repeat protein